MKEEIKYQYQVLTDEQRATITRHHDEFVRSRDVRDIGHDELDQMSIEESVEFNAKTAQSFIEPRKNATDINIVTGIPREKMLDVVSNILKLNLQPDVLAFNEDDQSDSELGKLFTYLTRKSNELEGDDVKQLLRMLYLLEQGTIFIEELWVPHTKKRKKMYNKNPESVGDGFSSMTWEAKDLTTYMCERRIVDITSVYLGNIKEFDINKQPYLFTREVLDYDYAKSIYGNWDNWDYVHKGKRSAFSNEEDDVPYRDFRLYELEDNQVEVLKYQNIWTDEYQIYINGVMMLPVDFPLPWEWTAQGDEGKCYSITKIVLEPISPYFAYGKSMMSKIRVHAELLDEMLRQMVRKTKQSTNPSVGNMTGQQLSNRLFDPGLIWENVNPDKVKSFIQHQGVTQSEYAFYNVLKETVDNMTVSQQFQGQDSGRPKTATEAADLQQQAQLALTLTIFSVRLMEERINYLRVQNILENWTRPIDTVVDEVNDTIRYKYRKVSLDNADFGDEVGTAQIAFIDHVPEEEERKDVSYMLLNEERGKGKTGSKRGFLSVPLLKNFRYSWKTRVNPSERESSNLQKVLFGEKHQQLMAFFGPQAVNMEALKKSFAKTWGDKYEDLFTSSSMSDMQAMMAQGGQSAGMNQSELLDRAKRNTGMAGIKPQGQL